MHVSGLSGQSAGIAQLPTANVHIFYRLQNVAKLSWIGQCVIYSGWICAQELKQPVV